MIDVLQVEDELRQILNRIDVVMGRRRNKDHTGGGMTHPGDNGVYFVTGKLAALAGLGALTDLDLDVVGIDQIFGGNAETARGHLFDG